MFCCIRCILYPGTQICIAAKTRPQGTEVLEKITSILMPNSDNLRLEIDEKETTVNQANACVVFKNGSRAKVVVSNDNARHNRSNCIIIDEFRMVDLNIINTVLRKFNTAPRQPKYLKNPKYKHLIERNKEFYLSSAWMKSHWSWQKAKAYCKNLVDDTKKYFICGLPYELSIKEGLLSADQVADEMSETDFNEIGWQMEMETLWFGSSESCYFNFDDLDKMRKIRHPLYPKDYYAALNTSRIKYESKQNGEIRLLSMDVAVMGGSKNDATAFFVMQLIPTSNQQYIRNIVYAETMEGSNTLIQALRVRRLYDDFDIDEIIMDTNGCGIGIYDCLVQEQIDDDRGVTYPAWTCINDDAMASRCADPKAPKIIYSIKASSQFNSDCAVMLRDAFKRGKIRLLINEIDGKDSLNTIKNFRDMSLESQLQYELPYYQTTALINEMINLDYENKDGKIKIKEQSGMRKDRYSSLSMSNFRANELERNLRDVSENDISNFSKYCSKINGNNSAQSNLISKIFR